MKKANLRMLVFVLTPGLIASAVSGVEPMGTAFTYQGQLKDGGIAVTDACDFTFTLWDAEATPPGVQVAPAQSATVDVEGGVFTVELDFGGDAFNGDARWLQMAVECTGDGSFTTLSPRQALTPTPHAIHADWASKGPCDCSGQPGYIAKFTNWKELRKSVIAETDGKIGIGMELTPPARELHTAGWIYASDGLTSGTYQGVDKGLITLQGAASTQTHGTVCHNCYWDWDGQDYKYLTSHTARGARMLAFESWGLTPDAPGCGFHFFQTPCATPTTAEAPVNFGKSDLSILPGKVIMGYGSHNVNVGVGTENPGYTLDVKGDARVYSSIQPDGYIHLKPNVFPGGSSVAIRMNEYRNHNYLLLSAYDQAWGNFLQTTDPGSGSGQGFGIMGGDNCAPFSNFVVNADAMFLGYAKRPGDGGTAGGPSAQGNLHVRGNVDIGGTLSKAAGSFKIDHPLDPENKYLYHSFVESPDMMNVYNGNAALDEAGGAWVRLPEWFEALNRDFRYQLTPIGAPGPNLHVAEEISANRFKIAGGAAGMRVSWQVTGIRRDPYANAHRIPVEVDKPADKRGRYLHPAVYGLSEDVGVHYQSCEEDAVMQAEGPEIPSPSYEQE